MIHRFPDNLAFDLPESFTDPFRYSPHPLVRLAAEIVMTEISGTEETNNAFSEGKMLGVLIIQDQSGKLGYLRGFSGLVRGKGIIPGFVPQIYDLTDPHGYFKKGELELNELNQKIRLLTNDPEWAALKSDLTATEIKAEQEIQQMKERIASSKSLRDKIRNTIDDASLNASLIKESQHQKAELKRIKDRYKTIISGIREKINLHEEEIRIIKRLRAEKSDRLQKWIFEQYVVSDANGKKKTIGEIFAGKGTTPPGGTGECAAPKLLHRAYELGLKPVAMGEFWYGQSPKTAVRTHGHFYPSCTSKCGPLLGHMTDGLTIARSYSEISEDLLKVIYEDESIIIVSKPSGMPSVPGLDGLTSAQEFLSHRYHQDIHAVHRLDMDTSGIIIFTKTEDAAINIRKQFEGHSVKKIYKARLCPADKNNFTTGTPILNIGTTGQIDLPLCADYDERPRQKVDAVQGKPALTHYKITSVNTDGTVDIEFCPHTGRTHQLRVHSAHIAGLCRPILGDMLYGGQTSERDRLYLHAQSITFVHPSTGESITFSSDINCFKK